MAIMRPKVKTKLIAEFGLKTRAKFETNLRLTEYITKNVSILND